MADKLFRYGNYYMQWCFRSSAGYPFGTNSDPDNASDGSTTHSYVSTNPIDYAAPQPSFARAIDRGGQKIRAQKDMGVTEFGEGTFSMSEMDAQLWAYWTGSTLDTTTVTGWEMLAMNVNQVTTPAGFVIFTSKAYDYESASDKWSHWVYPNAQVRITPPGSSQSDGENPNAWELTLIPNTSTRFLTGHLFSALNMTVVDNTDIGVHIRTAKPIAITTYVEAATPANAYTVGYRPSSASVDDSDKIFTKNGVTDTATSISATTGGVVTSGLVQSDISVVVYETAYTAI